MVVVLRGDNGTVTKTVGTVTMMAMLHDDGVSEGDDGGIFDDAG